MKRLIVYDLDGTLVDTKADIAQAAQHMIRQMGRPPFPQEEIWSYVGRGLRELVKSCLRTEDPQLIEEGSRIYVAYYQPHMLDHSRLYPGAREVLDYFQTRKQAVITQKPDPFSTELLTALGVARYFVAIIAGDTVYPKKPDPTSLLAVMRQVGASPQDTLVIGDSPIDVTTGRRAGVETVAVTHGFSTRAELAQTHPDLLVEGFRELVAVARQRGW